MAEKKLVAGVVDRIEGGVIVVVFKDPKDGENKEVYVDKGKFKKVEPKEGDKVSIEMCQMVMDKKTDMVSLVFSGVKPGEMAKRFFSYLVDGGLEDQLIDTLSGKGLTLEISNCDTKKLTVTFQCSKMKPAVKAEKKVTTKRAKKA